MRYLWLSLLLLSLPAWGETLYVRPAEGTYGSSNGSDYANAFDGFADVSWGASAGQVGDGDTLILCGTFDLDSVDGGATVMVSVDADGTSTTSRVTLDGDCSSQGDLAQAILDGEGTRDRGIDSGGTGRAYITLKNIAVRNFDAKGVYSQGTNTTTRAWRIENVDVSDIRGATADGFDLRGAGHWVGAGSSVTNIGEDAFYIEGDDFTASGVSCIEAGLDAVTGDCFQMNAQADNALFDGIRCEMNVDAKQCIFVSTTGFTGSVTIRDSYCDGPSASSTLHSCFFAEDLSGTITVERSGGKESRYLIYAGGTSTTLVARSNIGHDFSSYGIQSGTGSTGSTLENNTISRTPVCFSTESASGTNTIRNNVGTGCTTSGIRKNAGDTETNNAISDSGDFVQNETTTTTPGTGAVTADPQFSGGPNPTNTEGFRPRCLTSPLKNTGTSLGAIQDFTGRYFTGTPEIGAFACQGGTDRTTGTSRTSPSSRTAGNNRTSPASR